MYLGDEGIVSNTHVRKKEIEMKIDFAKCYNAMESSEDDAFGGVDRYFVRQAIKRYVTAYHEQAEDQIEKAINARARLHLDILHRSKTDSPPETCDCDGRKKLEKVGWLLCERGERWYHIMPWRNDRMLRETCPLCDKPLP